MLLPLPHSMAPYHLSPSMKMSCALQISVFGTSVFAARHMAACNWQGFAAGGALWFPDLTRAAAVIHWGQVRCTCQLLQDMFYMLTWTPHSGTFIYPAARDGNGDM
jgi:hypothetical protein